jgi:murein DD-endopeptidase MepM/ murein hydrolase activator NlpD
MHNGIDLATVSPDGVKGGTVVSAASGTVAFVRFDPGGYGNYLEVSHANGWSTLYGHLYSIAVQPGQKVLQGQVLGIEGTTGGSSGVHLHWEVRNGSDQRIDPATQIKVQAG